MKHLPLVVAFIGWALVSAGGCKPPEVEACPEEWRLIGSEEGLHA